jgi:hypothetical protein
MPQWLTTAITYLLPTSEDTKEPKNYLPITCSSAMCKTLTEIIAKSIFGRTHVITSTAEIDEQLLTPLSL